MQTFLPYESFAESAKILDYRRLGKQRVETWQILQVLLGTAKRNKNGTMAWGNHPAVKMWRGYETALMAYGIVMCQEWISRGFKDTMLDRFKGIMPKVNSYVLPDWLGTPEFHRAHRSNLLRKDPVHYGNLWPNETPDLEYVWPQ